MIIGRLNKVEKFTFHEGDCPESNFSLILMSTYNALLPSDECLVTVNIWLTWNMIETYNFMVEPNLSC